MGELSQLVSLEAGLYVVATPIGNLRDITLRALDILRSADHIYAEDTRQTQKLLNAYSIKAPLTAYHDHNTARRIPGIIKQIEAGASVALVSDAGTPLVSDPGFKLARDLIAAGLPVIPLPGASAPLAGLVTSGLPSDKFMFAGFLPSKTTARLTALKALKAVPATLIFFETGPRIKDSLIDMQTVLGDRAAAIARELTKRYEETRRGTLSDLIESVIKGPPKGEIVVLVAPPLAGEMWDETRVDEALKTAIPTEGVKRASADIASKAGWAKRDVYARALKNEMSRQAYEKAGRRAETLAVWYLRAKGYSILERRYKTKSGEIDIIARRLNILAIVEVKQRETQEAAEASLTTQAEKRISASAGAFFSRTRAVQNMDMRFDLIFVIGRWRITHIPDAWRDY